MQRVTAPLAMPMLKRATAILTASTAAIHVPDGAKRGRTHHGERFDFASAMTPSCPARIRSTATSASVRTQRPTPCIPSMVRSRSALARA